MRVFISYRRADSAGHAGRLYDSLEAYFGRDHVFMDLSAIDSGQNFVDAIDAAVRSCDALVAIIGDDWLTSIEGRLDQPADFVRSEIAAALERGIPVVPVLVEGTTMPSADALPNGLKLLATRQAHELSDARWSHDVKRLIDAIEKLGGKRRGWTRLSLAAAVALVAILTTIFIVRIARESDRGLQDAAAYAERGTQLLASGDYDRAIEDFTQALTLDPRPESYYNRGLAYFSKNEIDNAIADWNSAINLNPRDARAYRQRGSAYFTKGDYSLAVADYNRAIELEPQDAKAFYNRGLLFQARDERTKAIADFTTVVTLATDPDAARDAKARLGQLQAPASALVTAGGSRPSSTGSAATEPPAPSVNLVGEWSADVTYSWGAKYSERFTFKLDGNDVFGTASFLRVRRGIQRGSLSGNSIQFQTQTEEISGDRTRTVTHRYRGTISGNIITFFMQSDGASSSEPIEFTANRVDDGAK
jgi:tetratricopeptide (TPR) repeat protein